MKLHGTYNNTEFYIKRHIRIMALRSHGKTRTEIANEINISSKRIDSILLELIKTNNCINEIHLISTAMREGLIE